MRVGVTSAVVDGILVPGDISVRAGVVDQVALNPRSGAGGTAVAGFVDWQVNGFGGVDLTSTDAVGLARAAVALGEAGIVWAAPTFLNTSIGGYLAALEVLAEFRIGDPEGGLLGAHLEGPNLAQSWSGAHDPGNFLSGDPGLVNRLTAAGPIALVTVAPEVEGVMAVIPDWRSAGVTVALGHTDADLHTCARAARAGASALTHCWNAHRRFGPRDPGPAGWALGSADVTVGLIADGIHVAPEVLALTFAAAAGRVAVTTDAIGPAGTGIVESGGAVGRVTITDGAARLADGSLAGSVATPTSMLRVIESAGVAFTTAVDSMSVPQSAALGLTENRLRPGERADITVLGTAREVDQVWRTGRRIV